MTNTDVVKKLIGNIEPVGDSNEDKLRLNNLLAMCDLVADLMDEIKNVAKSKNSHQHSVSQIGKKADSFLAEYPIVSSWANKRENLEEILLYGDVIFELANHEEFIEFNNKETRKIPFYKSLNEEWFWIDKEGNLLVNSFDFKAAERKRTYPCKLYRVKALSIKNKKIDL